MTHKIYWAERGLRYLYEVVTAELFMYTFCMIFMRQDPRFVDAIWIAGIFLLSYLIRDFAPNHILLTVGHLVLAGLLVILPGTVWIRTVTGIYDIGYLLPCAVAYAKRGSGLTDMSEPWPSILAGIFGAETLYLTDNRSIGAIHPRYRIYKWQGCIIPCSACVVINGSLSFP